MATEHQPDEIPVDTDNHAAPDGTGRYGDRKDCLYVAGEGVYLSRSDVDNIRRACDAKHQEHGTDIFSKPSPFHSGFINENTIENWYSIIQASKKMRKAADQLTEQRKEYEATCHPGTDAQDPTLSSSRINNKRDNYSVDRSRSTVSIGTASGNRYLNGSAVEHSRWVRLTVNSPDGREICVVSLTFDQFASFLVSNSSTPCTIDRYWSVNDQDVHLTEVVKIPDSINNRMSQRLNDRLDESRKSMAELRAEIASHVDSNKSMSKTKLAELHRKLGWFMESFESNRDFTVEQAQEEVSSIVEQAACAIAWEHKLSIDEVLDSAPIKALVSSWKKPQVALPPASNG